MYTSLDTSQQNMWSVDAEVQEIICTFLFFFNSFFFACSAAERETICKKARNKKRKSDKVY